MNRPLLLYIRDELKRAGDPRKAATMQAYMKSEMAFHGVHTPLSRKICKEVFSNIEFRDQKHWESEILTIWRGETYREERYAALALSGHQRAISFQAPKSGAMYEELIVTGAWWDFIDLIAPKRVGPILRMYPNPMRSKMLEWSKSRNIWKRRTAILSQLKFKSETDLGLLYGCIEP